MCVDVERTLAVTILAGKSIVPSELRGFSDCAHRSVVHILECAHISVLPLYLRHWIVVDHYCTFDLEYLVGH
jgi:hypothetical protein